MESVKLEPKYCELCGALWLRPADAPEIYCPACARRVRALARGEAPQGRAQ